MTISFKYQVFYPTLIHHQNATCGVGCVRIPLRRMPNTPQELGLLRLASDILLVIRKLAE